MQKRQKFLFLAICSLIASGILLTAYSADTQASQEELLQKQVVERYSKEDLNRIQEEFAKKAEVQYSKEWFLKKSVDWASETNRLKKIKCAAEMEGLAKDCPDLKIKGKLLYTAASFYSPTMETRMDFEKTVGLFEKSLELNALNDDSFGDELGALRQLAQIYSRIPDYVSEKELAERRKKASEYYEKLDKKLREDTTHWNEKQKLTYYENFYPAWVTIKTLLDDKKGIIDVCDKAIEVIPAGKRSSFLITKARLLQKEGKNKESFKCFSQLFSEDPEYGENRGKTILVMLEQSRVLDPQEKSKEYVDFLYKIWDDPKNAGFFEHYNAGSHLLHALYYSKDARFETFALGYKKELEGALHKYAEKQKKYQLEGYLEQTMVHLAWNARSGKDRILEKKRLQEYMHRFPSGLNISGCSERYIELQEEET
ncbi:MAG: hypothetical protein IJU47_06735 [Verrucomicrobia bacterium]|nr:hypothetical protein [Verrucomicrobiota bacterium]